MAEADEILIIILCQALEMLLWLTLEVFEMEMVSTWGMLWPTFNAGQLVTYVEHIEPKTDELLADAYFQWPSVNLTEYVQGLIEESEHPVMMRRAFSESMEAVVSACEFELAAGKGIKRLMDRLQCPSFFESADPV